MNAGPVPQGLQQESAGTNPPLLPETAIKRLTWSYFALQLFLNFGNGAVVQFLIPFRVDLIDASDKVVNLGIIATVSSIVSLVALPVAGYLSDATRGRWGRRAPWMVAGFVGVGAVVALFALATTVAALLVLAVALTVAYAAVAAPLFAVLADRAPVEARGTIAAVGGLGMFGGLLAGVLVATALTDHLTVCFLVLAAVTLLGVPVARGLRRDSSALAPAPRLTWRETTKLFWVSPRRHPDFAWAFLARAVIYAGYTSIVAFMLYTLQDYVGMSRDDATDVIPVISLASIVALLVAVYPAGRISDKVGRRKAPVIAASLLMAAATTLPIFVPTLTAYVVMFVVTGFGFGIYLAVDQALMTEVLPTQLDAGKDLGILNIAQGAGQTIAPLIGSVAISLVGYEAMFAVGSVLAIIGAAAVVPIKGVR